MTLLLLSLLSFHILIAIIDIVVDDADIVGAVGGCLICFAEVVIALVQKKYIAFIHASMGFIINWGQL